MDTARPKKPGGRVISRAVRDMENIRMETQKIDAHKITKPIQLMAVWFIALLLIDSAFLTAAAKIENPPWMSPTLSIAAIVFVPLFLSGVFLMQTVFRKELQEDQYYAEWLKRQEETFKDFKPENNSYKVGEQIDGSDNITAGRDISISTDIGKSYERVEHPDKDTSHHNGKDYLKGYEEGKSRRKEGFFGRDMEHYDSSGQKTGETREGLLGSFGPYCRHNVVSGQNDDLEDLRKYIYQENKCIFLVHSWRPSHTPGQVADIVIWLHQHHQGPLSGGKVEKVEYQLGPKFFKQPKIKTNASELFRLEVSAYGPMLCVARIYIQGEDTPLVLERYINFEEAPNKPLHPTSG